MRTHVTLDPSTTIWTAIVASLDDAVYPRAAAVRERDAVSARGIAVDVLHSTRFPSLRPGYWVVYSKRFHAPSEAAAHAARLRSIGFGDAYERCVGPSQACAGA
jgi:hypothetical protein